MQARKNFVGGNWKSNNTLDKSKWVVENVVNKLDFDPAKVDVIVSPIFIHLLLVKDWIKNGTQVAGQNMSKFGQGAYTGEISGEHLLDIGLKWVILGHSERRHIKELSESNEYLAEKAFLALKQGLNVIYCVGEKIDEREGNKTDEVLKTQVTALAEKLKAEKFDLANVAARIVIAYEPVWAIGTGKTATPQIAQEAHVSIRKVMNDTMNEGVAQATRVIYGGSVTKANCAALIAEKDVDGFLVGGASLKEEFIDIVNSCK
jgi:triosephosphate isomerase